jgi:hypothetical protein
MEGSTASDRIVLELRDSRKRVVARIHLPALEMFWTEGRFERGEAFAAYEEWFRDLEQVSSRFQASDSGEAELMALARLWEDLNERFEIYERGTGTRLRDVGLHLNRDRALVRY